ncbi:MAG: hypothetical protein J6B04_05610 [Clostridia bacterium]|nr:hypothetical protein [Clostridia bacterium]
MSKKTNTKKKTTSTKTGKKSAAVKKSAPTNKRTTKKAPAKQQTAVQKKALSSRPFAIAAAILLIFLIIVIIFTVYCGSRVNYGDLQALKYNGEILSDTFELNNGTVAHIEVITADGEPKDYNVEILPNPEYNFEYSVDGKNYLFSRVEDLSEVFNVEINDNYFSISANGGILATLSALHGSDVTTDATLEYNDFYIMRVYSGDSEILVKFKVYVYGEFLMIHPDHIIY